MPPSLFLRVVLHFKYNSALLLEPRTISLIGYKWFGYRSDLGRAFAGICDKNTPRLEVGSSNPDSPEDFPCLVRFPDYF
jgi:hypothetical protein